MLLGDGESDEDGRGRSGVVVTMIVRLVLAVGTSAVDMVGVVLAVVVMRMMWMVVAVGTVLGGWVEGNMVKICGHALTNTPAVHNTRPHAIPTHAFRRHTQMQQTLGNLHSLLSNFG